MNTGDGGFEEIRCVGFIGSGGEDFRRFLMGAEGKEEKKGTNKGKRGD